MHKHGCSEGMHQGVSLSVEISKHLIGAPSTNETDDTRWLPVRSGSLSKVPLQANVALGASVASVHPEVTGVREGSAVVWAATCNRILACK